MAASAKARVWVDPYVQADGPVGGYWRDVDDNTFGPLPSSPPRSLNPDDWGDGWIEARNGKTYWGRFGAAGVLLTNTDADGVTRYFLAHRAPAVDQGDTWGIPGGAIDRGEDPLAGALRELEEEVGHRPQLGRVDNVFVFQPASDWAYTTSTVAVPERFEATGQTWEGTDTGWFTREEMDGLNLHPPFAASFRAGNLDALPTVVDAPRERSHVTIEATAEEMVTVQDALDAADGWAFNTEDLPDPAYKGEAPDAPITAEELVKRFHGLTRNDMRVFVAEVESYRDTVRIKGGILPPGDPYYGDDMAANMNFARQFSTFGVTVHQGEIHFDDLFVPHEAQGAGYGAAMLRKIDALGAELGAHRLDITAAHVGSYAWARAGFNWSNGAFSASMLWDSQGAGIQDRYTDTGIEIPDEVTDSEIDRFEAMFATEDETAEAWDRLYAAYPDEEYVGDIPQEERVRFLDQQIPPEKFRSAMDVANYGRENAWEDPNHGKMWLGKATLLGYKWDGSRPIQAQLVKGVPQQVIARVYDDWCRDQEDAGGVSFQTSPDGWGFFRDDDDYWETLDGYEVKADVLFAENLALLSKSARIWVDPYVKDDGNHISGYWREGGKTLDEIKETLTAEFKEIFKGRTKDGRTASKPFEKATYDRWKPPSGWINVGRSTTDKNVQLAAEIEYEDGKRGNVVVTGQHAGKAGLYKVTVGFNRFENYTAETQMMRDLFAAVDPSLDRDERKEADKKIAEAHGWYNVTHDTWFPKIGGVDGVKIEDGYDTRIVFTKPLKDYEERIRQEKLIDAEDPDGLLVGHTTIADIQSIVTGYGGWKLHDLGDGVYDLLYRRESSTDVKDLELKGHRLRFNENGVLSEVGRPTADGTDMGDESAFDDMVEQEKQKVVEEAEQYNERVVAISRRIKDAINYNDDYAPDNPKEMKKNSGHNIPGMRGNTMKNYHDLDVGDRFFVDKRVWEVKEKLDPPDVPIDKFKPADFDVIEAYEREPYSLDKGSYAKGVKDGRFYFVKDVRVGRYSDDAIMVDVETGEEFNTKDRMRHNRMVYPLRHKKIGIKAAPVTGEGSKAKKFFPETTGPDRFWVRRESGGDEALSVQKERGAKALSGGENWDETREALDRLGFRLDRRNNRGKGSGVDGGYTERWRRPTTGTTVYFQVEPGGTSTPSKFRLRSVWGDSRPYTGVPFKVVGDSVKIGRGPAESLRNRIMGRVPTSRDEWKQDMLGRADELAERYGEETSASVVTFVRAGGKGPDDMSAYIDQNGAIVLGRDVGPALDAYAQAVKDGTVTEDVQKAAWNAWETAQHEINHSVGRRGGWWGGYEDHDGTKNFEETLTEELARVMVNEWMDSSGQGDLVEWSRNNAASAPVQGAYQMYRANFKALLDTLDIPENDRYSMLEKWKFHADWRDRMKEFSELIQEKTGMTEDEAKQLLRESLSAKSLRNGFTEGALKVQEFRPIIPVGPLPARRSPEEIEQLRQTIAPFRTAFREAMDAWKAAKVAYQAATMPRDEAESALDRMRKARDAYWDKLDSYDLAPLREDYE